MVKTIVLIHGYGFDHRIWYPVELAFESFRVVYLSLPGFGTDDPDSSYSIASLAKKYWSEIDPIKSPVVHLAGHSMGGYVCMEMAAQQPSRVASLGLIHSHVFEDSAEKKMQRTAIIDHIINYGHDAVVRKMIPSLFAEGTNAPEIIDALVLRGLAYGANAWAYGAQAMRDRRDYSDVLKALDVPVLMIGGEKDNAVPKEWIIKQASFPAHARLHLYPGVGHMAMYENCARMICDLADFYARLK